MKRRHGLLAALTVFFLVAMALVASAQDPEGVKTLRDVPGVYVSVKGFDPDVEEAGLARDAWQGGVKEAARARVSRSLKQLRVDLSGEAL